MTASRLPWIVEEPAPSPFGSLAGDETLYRVRLLVVGDREDVSMRDAVREVVAEALRLASSNLTPERSLVLFAWDEVYSRMTVTFTDDIVHTRAASQCAMLFEWAPAWSWSPAGSSPRSSSRLA